MCDVETSLCALCLEICTKEDHRILDCNKCGSKEYHNECVIAYLKKNKCEVTRNTGYDCPTCKIKGVLVQKTHHIVYKNPQKKKKAAIAAEPSSTSRPIIRRVATKDERKTTVAERMGLLSSAHCCDYKIPGSEVVEVSSSCRLDDKVDKESTTANHVNKESTANHVNKESTGNHVNKESTTKNVEKESTTTNDVDKNDDYDADAIDVEELMALCGVR